MAALPLIETLVAVTILSAAAGPMVLSIKT